MDALLDEDEIPELQKFCDDVVTKHNNEFPNCDLTTKSNEEKIALLKLRYIFYHKLFPKCISTKDTLAIAKNNFLQMSIKMIRDVAKKHDIETPLSISITNECFMPMDTILIKYGKHKFQYYDEMHDLQELHSQFQFDDNNVLNPKILIHHYHKYDLVKKLYLKMPIKHQRYKIAAYFKKFESTFPKEFCIELQQCFLDGIQTFPLSRD